MLSQRSLSIAFALCIIAAVILSSIGWKVIADRRNVTIAGVASGLMGTITSAGGPPFAIVMQHMPPEKLRTTLGFIFTIGTLLSLAALAMMGRFTGERFWLSLLLVPWLMAGFRVSTWLMRYVPASRMRVILLTFALCSAVALLIAVW